MKKVILLLVLFVSLISIQQSQAQTYAIRVFDTVLFYDGYAQLSAIHTPAPACVVRLSTSLYTTKLTPTQLNSIGDSLSLKVVVKASCDNYDRIADVHLSLVHKGDTTYSISKVKRMEVARFITPFMDKNKTPDTVPYFFNINNVASILKEKTITDSFDIWCELEIFGVPYAANTQITGCSGRNDVFYGTLDLITNQSAARESNNILIPLGDKLNFNNYQAGATDTIGKTIKTISFTVDTTSYNSWLYLITSNHGANTNGEEYNRREHYVYFDGKLVMQYKPGYPSCEPYRVYNTQGNGIYGSSPMSNSQWQSFSNWCPGADIPIRPIFLDTVLKGTHTFKISVPTAVFNGGQGNFPLSLYFQGKNSAPNSLGIQEFNNNLSNTSLYPNPANDFITVRTENEVQQITVYNILGQPILQSNYKTVNIAALSTGLYYLKIQFDNNQFLVKSFVK